MTEVGTPKRMVPHTIRQARFPFCSIWLGKGSRGSRTFCRASSSFFAFNSNFECPNRPSSTILRIRRATKPNQSGIGIIDSATVALLLFGSFAFCLAFASYSQLKILCDDGYFIFVCAFGENGYTYKVNEKSDVYSFWSGLVGVDNNAIFALLLASLSNRPYSVVFINKCLFKLRRSFLLSRTSVTPILALLPTLLRSTRAEIACRAADIIGAASLVSFDANEEIASDSETVEGLVSLLQSRKRKVLLSTCNAVLDFSTTTFAKQQLLQFSALNKLMFAFLQIFKGLESVSLWSEGDESLHPLKIGIKEDEPSVAFLTATVVLINACEVEQLQSIPQSLSGAFLSVLKEIRARVSDQEVIKGARKCNEEGHLCKSNVAVSNLAESIFRLSINASQFTGSLPFEVVQRGLFGASDTSFEDFISNYWEVSPFLLTRTMRDPDMHDMFGAFIQSLNWKGSVPSLLSTILQGLVACFPIASDEQNILNFLSEVKDSLGCPIIYQQDIRVVKTESQSRKEMHYFQDFHSGCVKEPLYFTFDDVLKCGQAYEEGYTVALRGLEFRYQSIAAIAEALALMFGQPSVGANLYLTPPNSQGLACHFDDHCVFVCQIFGSKQWTIFSPPSQLLPRLYDSLLGSDIDCTKAGRREFFLREGDVLYIPRGFPHEAYTNSDAGDGSPEFSLHLTLSIEVEPPFEWSPSGYSSSCVRPPEEGGLCQELVFGLSGL
ncbi:Bifunctional lysine-specific demethylase and histidyl-hydroxylase NO66 [Spatholobus suberectus]|nr:Bifunctional lysine-specific demethylase and histidyl-hydroxylase NO66 [Spatholobus suberectus]